MELGRSAAKRLLIVHRDIFQIGSFDAVRFAAVGIFFCKICGGWNFFSVVNEQKRNGWDKCMWEKRRFT